MVLLAIVTLLGTLLSAVPASAAAGERYELVVQDGQYRYVIDRTENSKTWAGHCSDEVLGSTPNAVTWNDIKDLTQESTPECPELKRRLGTNTVGPGSSGPGTTTTTTPTTPATPATPAVESGDGFEWHTLSGPEYDAEFAEMREAMRAYVGDSVDKIEQTGQVVAITSLKGLRDAGLPLALVSEILDEDFGYSGWSAVPASQLTAVVDSISVNMDAYALRNAPDTTGRRTVRGWCDKEWVAKGFEDSRVISKSIDKTYGGLSFGENSASGYASANLSLSGNLDYRINYSYKQRKCLKIPYKARFDSAEFELFLRATGSIDVAGQLSVATDPIKLFEKRLNVYHWEKSFTVKIFYFKVEADIDVELGAELKASTSHYLDSNLSLTGSVFYSSVCDSRTCEERANRSGFNLTPQGSTDYSSRMAVTLTPYAGIEGRLKLKLYGERLLETGVGAVVAAPISAVAAVCSHDGEFDSISAFDISAEYYAYWFYDVPVLNEYDIQTMSLAKRSEWVDVTSNAEADGWYTRGPRGNDTRELDKKVKSISTRLLNNTDGALIPKINVGTHLERPWVVAQAKGCWPFDSNPMYEITFGDGSTQIARNRHRIFVPFDGVSQQSATIQLIGDDHGRELSSPKVNLVINKDGTLANGICGPTAVDPDGDGWGWEDGRSCRMV